MKNAINGKPDRNDKGWALHGSDFNAPHRAMFQLKEPVAAEKGVVMTIRMLHRYSNGDYPLGHFRVYLTDAARPLKPGLPVAVAAAVKTPPGARAAPQNQAVESFYRTEDAGFVKAQVALWGEQRPLPPDAKMEGLKAALAKAEQPIQQDSRLLQLRQDVEMSIDQAANRRLTAAQDLTWALINNPAFLFNY